MNGRLTGIIRPAKADTVDYPQREMYTTLRQALRLAIKESGFIAKMGENDYLVLTFRHNMSFYKDDVFWEAYNEAGCHIPQFEPYGTIDLDIEGEHTCFCMCEDCFQAYVDEIERKMAQ